MAYEHGSTSLDIRNPFRFEGSTRTIGGLVIVLWAVYLLLGVASVVKSSHWLGWVQLAIAAATLVVGLKLAGSGLMQVFRFYVGRGVPLSLAPDLEQANPQLKQLETHYGRYRAKELDAMLVGRKNTTFQEPEGMIERFVHSLFPNLIFMPNPYRNLVMRICNAIIASLIALLSYAVISFVTSVGLVGNHAEFTREVAQWVILGYLLVVWFRAALGRGHGAENLQRLGTGAIVKPLVLAVALPLTLAQALAMLPSIERLMTDAEHSSVWKQIEGISATAYLILLLGVVAGVVAVVAGMMWWRLKQANPITEVAEYRDIWQEDVHPRELFISLENIVLANRRYREIPNRVYRALEPVLNEQANGKGDFSGELLIETQPAPRPYEPGSVIRNLRMVATVVGLVLVVVATILMADNVLASFQTFAAAPRFGRHIEVTTLIPLVNQQLAVVGALILAGILFVGGRILHTSAHFLWAEMPFESYLLNFKCSGTFKETRFVTGRGVYDSTQSDNQVVRSDITPWVTLSRIVSSTFAGVGSLNLEGQRYILEMHRDDAELNSIIDELRGTLEQREKVASIRNENDLRAIEQIDTVNRISRQERTGEQILPNQAQSEQMSNAEDETQRIIEATARTENDG